MASATRSRRSTGASSSDPAPAPSPSKRPLRILLVSNHRRFKVYFRGYPWARELARRGHEVDLLWPQERLIVEIDGYAYHGSRAAFERDRRRDARLLAAGYRVLRVSWRQIADDSDELVATLTHALVT